ncbi:tannase and feruloyl esterase [Dothidotthia symphoricarpi CBS 119687]|uniref:Carboxylic ester hydrolase n=1 Tax=Dothidotthia symphoricarpi CBS 119687 TaxID=1392245 RepID=A0A6A6AAN0_9PLEO|nr:tannase and feruloyl esterase [Dothidotthia symphoricarpi CBS 119687]KAF2128215.1 tannase and feruloyl esterase [Dothidotthia symphoricarpi CBS 119687]
MKFDSPVSLALLGASSALASPASAPANFTSQCASMASKLSIPNSVVNFAQFVTGGTNLSLAENDVSCAQSSMVVPADICRVGLYVATSTRSGFNMEAWLPSNWTGRFLSGGNGGLNGCIKYQDLAYTSGVGFASVGTNNGHNGTRGYAFANNTDVVQDFAYRAMHTGVVVGKQVTKAFYGKTHKKSYYFGCSTGGRQGFKAAQDFPEDFDGIVAGAPAVSFNNLTSWSGRFYTLTGTANSSTFVTRNQWLAVHDDILKQCDALDGYVDGILEDPMQCNYDPSGLACAQGSNTTTCLTPTQLKTVKGVFSPLLNAAGDLAFPRLNPGAEVSAYGPLLSGSPFPYTVDWFRYVVYNNASWDPASFNSADIDYSSHLNPFGIETWKGDLSAVKKRGGKILHWHGQADQIITSENSPRYYNHVSKTMGLSSAQLDAFYRFFRISGTNHCTGGNGAHAIGQASNEINSYKPEENVLMAIVEWVEKGSAPETIVGTKFVNDTVALGVQFQRAHCKYPKRNMYKGTGDATLVSSWHCVE